MLVELGQTDRNVYKENFENWFIDDAEKFYRVESNKYISENTCTDYLKKAASRIKEEKNRVHK